MAPLFGAVGGQVGPPLLLLVPLPLVEVATVVEAVPELLVAAPPVPLELDVTPVPTELDTSVVPTELDTSVVPTELDTTLVPTELDTSVVPTETETVVELGPVVLGTPPMPVVLDVAPVPPVPVTEPPQAPPRATHATPRKAKVSFLCMIFFRTSGDVSQGRSVARRTHGAGVRGRVARAARCRWGVLVLEGHPPRARREERWSRFEPSPTGSAF
jgi:hypothetical protein